MSALQTAHPDAAAAFYAAVFGWQTQPFGPATLFRLPGYVGGTPDQPVERDVVAVMLPASTSTSQWSVDFWTSALAAAATAATTHGGRVLYGASDAAPFRQAIISDPHGATLSLSQLVSEPPPSPR